MNHKREVGRRLYAAILSCQLRLQSLDYTLKNHVPEELDPSWGELGWELQRGMASGIADLLRGIKKEE
jgi:hypothetical protein